MKCTAPLTLWMLAAALAAPPAHSQATTADWREEFNLAGRTLTHTGESSYFLLKPGFQLVLESKKARLLVTVLDETREIAGITTRVVEEKEEKKGQLFEISRNFFAMDEQTGDVFYFGEDVDFYKKGRISGHAGAWLAYEKGNRPGLMMPGTPEVGMKYYQELAPGVAMDRAEVVSVSETFGTPAGEFKNCLRTKESTKLRTLLLFRPTEYKTYAPGIGLIQDQDMKLVRYGFLGEGSTQE